MLIVLHLKEKCVLSYVVIYNILLNLCKYISLSLVLYKKGQQCLKYFESHSQYILYIALMSNIHTYILIYLQIFLLILSYCRLLNKCRVFIVLGFSLLLLKTVEICLSSYGFSLWTLTIHLLIMHRLNYYILCWHYLIK